MYINTSIYNVPEFNLSFGSGYDEVDFNFSFIRFSWPLFRYNSALNLKKKPNQSYLYTNQGILALHIT